jgi:nuclear pore complex protein Nup210
MYVCTQVQSPLSLIFLLFRSTKNPTTITLSAIDPVQPRGCSAQAVVSAVISEVGRHTAIIIAEDVSSGEVLRCDVIVDSIASLSIVTTTREIFIEEAPEVFEVRAYDDLGKILLSFV